MAKIAVVEDNDAMRAQLCGFIAQYAQESGHQLDVTAFSDGAQLVEPYRPGFDIIFLDIESDPLYFLLQNQQASQIPWLRSPHILHILKFLHSQVHSKFCLPLDFLQHSMRLHVLFRHFQQSVLS